MLPQYKIIEIVIITDTSETSCTGGVIAAATAELQNNLRYQDTAGLHNSPEIKYNAKA